MSLEYEFCCRVEGSVISFIEKTWYMWWMLAVLVILRWFQLFSSEAGGDHVVSSPNDEQVAAAASLPLPSGGVSHGPFAA